MERDKKNSPYYTFHQVVGLLHHRSHQLLEKQGVYPGQPPLLFALHKEDGQSQKQLSEKLGVQPATMTVMVKRMTKAGLLERKQDPKDQRISRVYLTQEGRIMRERTAKIIHKIEEECFENFTEEEKKQLDQLLGQMKENLLQKNA